MTTPPATASPLGVLRDACDELVHTLDASGCAISRVIGDLLVQVAEDSGPLRHARSGRGYLASDYPRTEAVLREREPHATSVEDDDADPAEVSVLVDLGYVSLLMLPFVTDGEVWGLVEVYGEPGRAFDDADAERALAIARALALA